jgi:hypothetical protein
MHSANGYLFGFSGVCLNSVRMLGPVHNALNSALHVRTQLFSQTALLLYSFFVLPFSSLWRYRDPPALRLIFCITFSIDAFENTGWLLKTIITAHLPP